ncbi:MAG: hypothetical protein ACNA8W_14950, partial [Bradymonadaceae bacterium]
AGVDLSSKGHVLQLQAAHVVEIDQALLEPQARASQSALRFGSRYGLGQAGELHVDAAGAIGRDEFGSDAGMVSARLAWQRVIGSQSRAYVLPWTSGRLGYALLPEDPGMAVGTAGEVFVGAEAALAFEGRFNTVRHQLRPRVLGFGEVIGSAHETTPASTLPSFSSRGAGIEGLRVAGSILEQAWTLGSGWRMELPVAILLMSDSENDLHGQVAGSWRLTKGGFWQVRTAGSCGEGCETWAFIGDLQWPMSERLIARHLVVQSRGPRSTIVFDLLQGASPAVMTAPGGMLIQEDAGWFYRHSLYLQTGFGRFELGLPGVIGGPSLPGVDARIRLGPRRLNWYLALDGAVEPWRGDWVAMIGLGL